MSIVEKLQKFYPDCGATTLSIFPAPAESKDVLGKAPDYDDVVFITFQKTLAYIGREYLSHRLVDLMDALQSTDRIVAHLHIGNPYVGACAPYTPRYINAYCSEKSIDYALDILAGLRTAKGVMPYDDIDFKKKGHVFY
jgi:hypothetical protein